MKNKLILFLLFLIPYFLIFRSIFLGGELAFGDAPYFYPENLNELFNLPFIWDIRYSNFGAPQGSTLWLYLPTFLYGLLNHYFGFSSEVLIRAVFIIPSSILGFLGGWKFFGFFSKNIYGKFLSAFFYLFNTYYILLIDGGQIGVALAFGLFPWVILSIYNFQKKGSLKNFISAIILFFIITNVDIRVAFISTVLLLFFLLFKRENIKRPQGIAKLILVLGIVLFLDSFWFYPLVKNHSVLEAPSIRSTQINFVSILNSLLLYQPHFPNNDFGKLILPPFYFAFLLPILFSGLFFIRKDKKPIVGLCFIFLIFVFLTKGRNFPLGEAYAVIDYVPIIGAVFRDSSKFFIPLFLIAGILLGLSYEILSNKIESKNSIFLFVALYMFLITLVSPAFFGQLSGGLNNNVDKESFLKIYKILSSETDFSRTLWFDERPPLGYTSWDKPALSANALYLKRPFADMIEGSYDLNGFLNSPLLKDWLQISGVKYIFLPENERKKMLTEKQQSERKIFLRFVNDLGMQKVDWKVSFPVYKVEGTLPLIYSVENVFLISGGGKIFSEFKNNGISFTSNPTVFIDDAKFSIDLLSQFAEKNDTQIIVQGEKVDFVFSLLRDKMQNLSSYENDWATKDTSVYLETKGELLERGVKSFDYDFDKGLSYSSIKNEEIKIIKTLDDTTNFILAIRYVNATDSAGIKLNTNSQERELKSKSASSFEWEYFNLKPTKKLDLLIKNLGGLSVVNTIIIIPQQEFEAIKRNVGNILSANKVTYINEETDYSKLQLNKEISKIKYELINPTKYKVYIPNDQRWIIFTDSYDKNWVLKNSRCELIPVPIYSFINGFYIDETCKNNSNEWLLYYRAQQDILVGIFLSLLFSTTLIIGIVGFLYFKYGIFRKNN